MTQRWFEQRLLSVDLRTSGQGQDARITGGHAVALGSKWPPVVRTWRHDQRADRAVEEIVGVLADAVPVVALVVPDARHVLTVLDRDARRYGIASLGDRVGGTLRVLDPVVLDHRLGGAGIPDLPALCRRWQVRHDGPRTRAPAAFAAARAVWRMGALTGRWHGLSATGMHENQVRWARDQAAAYEAHLTRTGTPRPVERAWPLVPAAEPSEVR